MLLLPLYATTRNINPLHTTQGKVDGRMDEDRARAELCMKLVVVGVLYWSLLRLRIRSFASYSYRIYFKGRYHVARLFLLEFFSSSTLDTIAKQHPIARVLAPPQSDASTDREAEQSWFLQNIIMCMGQQQQTKLVNEHIVKKRSTSANTQQSKPRETYTKAI